ncbi:hypothetical protein ACFX19_037141 [Malus domestica]
MVGQEEGNMRSIQAELRLIREILSKQLKSTLLDLILIRVPRIPILESKDQINIIIRATICSIIINSKELILSHIQLPLLNHLSRQTSFRFIPHSHESPTLPSSLQQQLNLLGFPNFQNSNYNYGFPHSKSLLRGSLAVARLDPNPGLIPEPEDAGAVLMELFGKAESLLYMVADAAMLSTSENLTTSK